MTLENTSSQDTKLDMESYTLNSITPEAIDLVMEISAIMGRGADTKGCLPKGLGMSWDVETDPMWHDDSDIGRSFPSVWVEQCEHGHVTVKVITEWVTMNSEMHKRMLMIAGLVHERYSPDRVSVSYNWRGEDDTAEEAHHVH